MTKLPDYVAEFQRWHAASGPQRLAIAAEQAMKRVKTPRLQSFDVITPCGKQFDNCTKEELGAMAAWEEQLAKASVELVDQYRARVKLAEKMTPAEIKRQANEVIANLKRIVREALENGVTPEGLRQQAGAAGESAIGGKIIDIVLGELEPLKPRTPEQQDFEAVGGFLPSTATDEQCAERYNLAVAAMLIRLYGPKS